MKLPLLVCSIVFTLVANVYGQKDKVFPSISGEDYKDKIITLPDDTKGKMTLIGMAYSKKSEDDLKTWFNPVYQMFIYKSEKPSLFEASIPDVHVYFLPMFTGINQAAAGTAKNKMIKGIDEKLLPYIIFYKGELKKYKDELDFEKKDIPYFFVLDEEGKIIYATSGAYSEKKMDSILGIIEEDDL